MVKEKTNRMIFYIIGLIKTIYFGNEKVYFQVDLLSSVKQVKVRYMEVDRPIVNPNKTKNTLINKILPGCEFTR